MSPRKPSLHPDPRVGEGDDEHDVDLGYGYGDIGNVSNPAYGYHPPRPRPNLLEPRPLHIGNRRTFVGLTWREPYWEGTADVPFRPEGLVVMVAPVGAMLVEWLVGAELVLPAGRSPVLLSTFTTIEQGRHESARPSYATCGPGVLMRLRLSTRSGEPLPPDAVEMTVWGITPTYV